ncbi:Putative amino acid permease F13H10.3 [Papilio machaon]|uniref:Putative amino acid permease F13H10.3 n=1 Tax=Papilio machaon TaxID=76193 RepID=A0A194RAH9_PAPMA|nr:Putative amino acid permease F13H10.3 [Papilio machaon]
MRLVIDARGGGEESAPSSLQSNSSYGIFGSACSDMSDCECGAEHYHYETYKSPFCSHSESFSSAMNCGERTPLLPAAHTDPVPIMYNTISSSDSLGPGEISGRDIIETYKRLEKENKSEPERSQSSLVTIFSVWNTMMGSSLLAMAWGVARAGLPVALLLLTLMAALCLYTAHILLTVNRHHGGARCEVPALCGRLLGAGAAAGAHLFSLLVLLGATVVYWLLMANFLYHTVNYVMDLTPTNGTKDSTGLLCPKQDAAPVAAAPLSPYWGLHTTVPLYVALGMFPLLNFPNVTFFTKFNSLGTLSVAYLVVFVVYKGVLWGVHPAVGGAPGAGPAVHGAGLDAAALSGMLALSFYIHNIIITIMTNNRKQENNGRDLSIAFLLVTVTYTVVGAGFYICFPLDKACIEDNILNNFEMHDVMTAVARALLLFQVVTVYPLVAFMLRCEVVLLLGRAGLAAAGGLSRVLTLVVNAAIVFVCVLLACLCPNISTVIRYTGAVSGLVHVFALPSLLQLRSLRLRGRLSCGKVALYSAILLFGVANLAMQFFVT